MSIDLQGTWILRYNNTERPVEVPGVIEKYIEKRDEPGEYSYHRKFSISQNLEKRYILHCQGISYAYRIVINSDEIFEGEGIWQTSSVDITDSLKKDNHIEVIITRPSFDASSPYHFRSLLFGFIPDVLFPFSGIFRPLFIEEVHPVYCQNIQINSDVKDRSVSVCATMSSDLTEDYQLRFCCFFADKEVFRSEIHSTKCTFSLDSVQLWTPPKPNLYQLRIEVLYNGTVVHRSCKKFGFREIAVNGSMIKINGDKQYFRGVLHWGYYPEEMSVYQNEAAIRQELSLIKSMGFNGIKFCLFIPDQRYYEICDELGIMVWQELPLWLPYDNGYLIDRIQHQFPQLIQQVISHPSLFCISIGCELDSTVPTEVLDSIYDTISSCGSSVLICDNSGGGECFDGNIDTKSDIYDYHFYGEIHQMNRLIQEFTHKSRKSKPWFFGEFNDMDTYRNIDAYKNNQGEVPYWANKDFGINLLRYVHQGFGSDNPVYNFTETVAAYGYQNLLPHIEKMSLRKAYWIRKYNLETVRTYNTISGYAVTALRDVPITTSGLIDDHGSPKFSQSSMCMINGDMVISMLPPLRRCWVHGADMFDSHDRYNFQEGTPIDNRVIISSCLSFDYSACIEVCLTQNGNTLHRDTYPVTVQCCEAKEYIQLNLPLPETGRVERYDLRVQVGEYHNQWYIWSYPTHYKTPFSLYDPTHIFEGIESFFSCKKLSAIPEHLEGVLLTTVYTPEIEMLHKKGIHLIYINQGLDDIPFEHLPFWRENVKVVHNNPYFDELQHLGFDGANFLSLTTKIGFDALILRKIYPDYIPLITRVDNRNFRLHEHAFFVPGKGGQGNMIVTSFNFSAGVGDQSRSFDRNYFGGAFLNTIVQIAKKGLL